MNTMTDTMTQMITVYARYSAEKGTTTVRATYSDGAWFVPRRAYDAALARLGAIGGDYLRARVEDGDFAGESEVVTD